jgi:hypothetical protein
MYDFVYDFHVVVMIRVGKPAAELTVLQNKLCVMVRCDQL